MVKRNEYVTVNEKTNKKYCCTAREVVSPLLKQDTIQRRQDKGYLLLAKKILRKQKSKGITFRSTFVT
jgi:hypothetical protein